MHDCKGVPIEFGDGIAFPYNGNKETLTVGVVVSTFPGASTCNLTVCTPVIGGMVTHHATAADCEVITKAGLRVAAEVIVGDMP